MLFEDGKTDGGDEALKRKRDANLRAAFGLAEEDVPTPKVIPHITPARFTAKHGGTIEQYFIYLLHRGDTVERAKKIEELTDRLETAINIPSAFTANDAVMLKAYILDGVTQGGTYACSPQHLEDMQNICPDIESLIAGLQRQHAKGQIR